MGHFVFLFLKNSLQEMAIAFGNISEILNLILEIRFQKLDFRNHISEIRNQILEIMVITSLLEMSSAKQIQEPLLMATFHFLSPPIS